MDLPSAKVHEGSMATTPQLTAQPHNDQDTIPNSLNPFDSVKLLELEFQEDGKSVSAHWLETAVVNRGGAKVAEWRLSDGEACCTVLSSLRLWCSGSTGGLTFWQMR